MPILLPAKKENEREGILPLIPIRNLVAFPFVDLQLIFGRAKSVNALTSAYEGDKLVFVVSQKDPRIDEPKPKDLYQTGVICRVEHVVRIDGTVHSVFKGVKRAKIVNFLGEEPYTRVKVMPLTEKVDKTKEGKILADQLVRELKKAFNLGKTFDPSILVKLGSGVNIAELVDQVAFSLEISVAQKQKILETLSLTERLKLVGEELAHEMNVLKLDKTIEKRAKDKFDKRMKRAVLEERKRMIDKELKKMGITPGENEEIAELRGKIKKAKMPKEARKKADRELSRLSKMSPFAPEASYIRTYLEWLVDIPWSKKSKDETNLAKAKKILDDDHHGLKEAKERILEHLAVMKLKKDDSNGSVNILCFLGPPGVGKTSLGKSIARSLGRKFVRVSLGGIRDEAEIRGHRRTYVGAMPGRIIQGIKNAGTKNPVFMLDEIDKVGVDFRGDPTAALLEALDPEQNKEFSDHYVEIPYDLSEVFFILTANVADTIPRPLLDRLETIRFSGYTQEEKLQIAKKYLVPRQLAKHGLNPKQLVFKDKILKEIIAKYTREAGVRELERVIASVCRKTARKIAEKKKVISEIALSQLHRLLGPFKFSDQLKNKKDEVGVATGLAWTQTGGDILFIEVALMPGKGRVSLTGKLGDVMKESCQAALSYVRSNWKSLGIKDKDFSKKLDFHVHVPEGAVPKDGPSAGVTIVTALVSALTNRPIKKDIGMTGEITLRGKVLPIGGIKEKTLAAHRAGIKTIILPKENKRFIEEIPKKVRDGLKFIFVEEIGQVLKEALV